MDNVSNNSEQFQLLEFMRANGISQNYLAAALQTYQPNVCKWLQGKSTPPVWAQLDLEVVAGIPMQSWYTNEKGQQLTRLDSLAEFASELRPTAARRANERIKTLSENGSESGLPGVEDAGDP